MLSIDIMDARKINFKTLAFQWFLFHIRIYGTMKVIAILNCILLNCKLYKLWGQSTGGTEGARDQSYALTIEMEGATERRPKL